MEDIIIRSRYPRHANYGRKRRKNTRENDALNKTVFRQFVISAVMLVLVMTINTINSPVAKYISGAVKQALSQSIDMGSLYSGIQDYLGINSGEKASEDQEDAVPVNASANETGDGIIQSVASNEESSTALQGLTLIMPVDGVVTSNFGTRTDPLTKTEIMHYGIDIDAETGTDIKAVLNGVTAETGSSKTYGNYVKLSHGDGLFTIYAHCSKITTVTGQKIKQGDVIAKAGNTGRSVGSHLHFEIWKDQTALDPLKYMDYQSGSSSAAQGL